MPISHNVPLQEKLKRWSYYFICLTIALGACVLLGWEFDLEFLKRPLPYLATMNPLSAILFMASGLAFLCFSSEMPSKITRLGGYLALGFVLVPALLRLAAALHLFDAGVDLLLFPQKLQKEVGNFSNRMSPNTAFCFTLISLSLPLLRYETSKKKMPAHYLALIIGLVGVLSVLGCVYRVQPFYMVLVYIPMAIHTAIGFLLISLAILFSSPGKGLMREFTSTLSGSQTARLLIPAAIVIPMLLGYLRLLGHWSHAYSVEFGVAVLVLSIIIVFVLLIWFNSASLNKKDVLRIKAEIKLMGSVRKLQESEEKFQKAFEASAAGISITRLSDSAYMEINEAFIDMTGYSKEELIHHTSAELGITVDMEKREEVLQKIREHGKARQFEMSIRHKSGAIINILASIETILLNGEKYAINIIFDITDRKLAEMQLEAVNKELEAFSYSVSHDLRAPLRAIDGYAKMLEEDYGQTMDKEAMAFLGAIQHNAKKMSQLIDDLLAFSRLGRKTIHTSLLNMNELVSGILLELQQTSPHRAEIKMDSLHPAMGDASLVKQVMINLLSNAIKYSSKKPDPVVAISSELRGDEVLFTVKDNGNGFDMAYADKLFGVFQRLHSEAEFEGTGVGLAIVQRIVDKHGGRIWAEAEVDRGATFHFTLPTK